MSDEPDRPADGAAPAARPAIIEPARTHRDAAELFRRPFAPGAIGFFPGDRVDYRGSVLGGAQIRSGVRPQSIVQRLNAAVPGRWTQAFQPVAPNGVPLAAEIPPPGARMYLLGTLTVRLPHEEGGPDVEVVYQDVGEIDAGRSDALKALYSDARKRSAVPAGIGAYLYTSMPRIVLPIVSALPAPPPDANPHVLLQGETLTLPAATERWLRTKYDEFVKSAEDLLGEVLRHGEADESAEIVGEPVQMPTSARAVEGAAAQATGGAPESAALGERLTAAASRLRATIAPVEEREPAAATPEPVAAQPAAPPDPTPTAPADAAPPASADAAPASSPAAPPAASPSSAPAGGSAPRVPPPAPVQPVAQQPASAAQEIGASGSLSPLTAAQQEEICQLAIAHGVTAGKLVNLIIGLTGGQQRSEEAAAHAFDDGFLATTPAYLFEAIRAALDPAQQQLPTGSTTAPAPAPAPAPVPAMAGAATNGHAPVDFRGLGAP